MAGGVVPTGTREYNGRFTIFVALACIVASSGGFLFGYDIGISGGVTSMDSFLGVFFPKVLRDRNDRNTYCRYNNQLLQTFTSSLYLAGMIVACFAAPTTRRWGRLRSILLAGIVFMIGAILNASAQNLTMLIIGRMCLGIGVGFANQAVPLYLSEMAHTHYRGATNNMFQFFTSAGILIANLINYGMGKVEWGWRLSLGLAIIPATILTLGGIFLPETPNSLIERNLLERGKATLCRIRGTSNVTEEYEDIIQASRTAKAIVNPLRSLLNKCHRPHLTVIILVPFFQQITGINAIMFYAPVLFKTIGFKDDASLYSSVITGGVILLGCVISIFTVDRLGRRFLFFAGGIQMLICQVIIGLILLFKLPLDLNGSLPHTWAAIVLLFISLYVLGFGLSWGPLGWLVPTEILPLEIRSFGSSVVVFVNFLFTFIIGQAFLNMLCSMEWGIFFFFSFWVVVMTMYIYFFLPETKNIPIEEMELVWAEHWFWRRYVTTEEKNGRFQLSL